MTRGHVFPAVVGAAIASAGFLVALVLGLGGVVSPGGDGQTFVASHGSEKQPGSTEGIAVHGEWTVDVLETDGSLVARHQFSNAYIGGANLARLLGKERVPGVWVIEIASANLCRNASGTQVACEMHESHTALSGPHIFGNLTTSVPSSGANSGKLVLSGTATAAVAGTVASVSTKIRTCPNTSAPANCTGGSGIMAFTDRSIPVADRPTVAEGQQIAVTVVIDFN